MSVSKGEKTSKWRKYCFLLAVLTAIMMLVYNSSYHVSQSLKTWANWTRSSPNISTVHVVSQEDYYVRYPHPYSVIIDEPHRCAENNSFLVLMVPVLPQDRRARDIIRETWGGQTNVLGRTIQHYFILGLTSQDNQKVGDRSLQQRIFEESQLHHDLIQFDFLDSYKNLTIKTMLMFQWLTTRCRNSRYAMKIDSDIFLNVQNLVRLLLDAPTDRYMTGFVVRHAWVLRDNASKWYMPHWIYPESNYPPYALGLGYVFSMDLPEMILNASRHVKPVYIEDVYVGLCLGYLKVAITDPPKGDLFRAGAPSTVNKCYWTSVITTIMRNSEHLLETWRTYQSLLQSC